MTQDQRVPSEGNEARNEDEEDSRGPRQFNSELAKAFEDLAKGERTATALENRLDSIEGHIEQLLASVEQQARERSIDNDHEPKTTENSKSK